MVKANLKAVCVFPDDNLAAISPFQLLRHQHQLLHDVGEPEKQQTIKLLVVLSTAVSQSVEHLT